MAYEENHGYLYILIRCLADSGSSELIDGRGCLVSGHL
jgi:hypothetical protein